MSEAWKKRALEARKKDIFAVLTAHNNNAVKASLSQIEAKVIQDDVSDLRSSFNALKVEIFNFNAQQDAAADKVSERDFETFSTLITSINKNCVSKLHGQPSVVSQTSAKVTNTIFKDKLQLSVFDGKIGEWQKWFQLFSTLVDSNNSLSITQKFLYLHQYLDKEPLSIIDDFEINDENYPTAVQALKDRYENHRRLGSYYLNKMISCVKNSETDNSAFLTVHRTAAAAFKGISGITDKLDFILFWISYRSLDSKTQEWFNRKMEPGTIPTHKQLLDYVQNEASNKELKLDVTPSSVYDNSKSKKDSKFGIKKGQGKTPFVASTINFEPNESNKVFSAPKISEKKCPCCEGKHKLFLCDNFKQLAPNKRFQLVKKWKRCSNCLASSHQSGCTSKFKCYVCQKDHHTLLHCEAAVSTAGSSVSEGGLVTCISAQSSRNQALLGTIACELQTGKGTFMRVRCLYDTAAQTSLIKSAVCKKARVNVVPKKSRVHGVGETCIQTEGLAPITLRGINSPQAELRMSLPIVAKVAGPLPTYSIEEDVKEQFNKMNLADANFNEISEVDIIIGADYLYDLVSDDEPSMIKFQNSKLIAHNTIFGYVILGKLSPSINHSEHEPAVMLNCCCSLEQLVERFWETEEVSVKKPVNPEDLHCEEIFRNTTKRLPCGRYSVRLPFKPGACPEKLENRRSALMNFKNLERRLEKKGVLHQYREHFEEYKELRQMVIHRGNPADFIVPQVVVLRQDAVTTKLRVVFNASCTSHKGEMSFNDMLMQGPKLQKDLSDIILRFRLGKVPITGDMKMMFRMVAVAEEDRKFQHIFYRGDDGEIVEAEIGVLLFGHRSSPYLAQRVVKQLLEDERRNYPEAAESLEKDTYVDDYVKSVNSIEEATKLKEEVSNLMGRGGFTMHKWASSYPEVLSKVTSEMARVEFNEESKTLKVLGLQWVPKTDSFTFKVTPFEGNLTKRSCWSYVAKTFDCLGLVCPVIFWMKSFNQLLWKQKLDWDDPLPEELSSKWLEFTSKMECLNEIKISRWVNYDNAQKVMLAGFPDGSSLGYAACIYLIVRSKKGTFSNLIKSKSKLSPVKTISIPRLELCGFLLLSKLYQNVLSAMTNIKVDYAHLFSDSEIVINWLKTPAYMLEVYEANRVTKILKLTGGVEVSHVKSELNPSDCATRGLYPDKLSTHSLWWRGPTFLQEDTEMWKENGRLIGLDKIPGLKKSKTVLAVIDQLEGNPLYPVLERFSTFGKLCRVFGFVLRFIHNCRATDKRTGLLSVNETELALFACAYIAQTHYFSGDINAIKQGKPTSSNLRKLTPTLNASGLLCVGGRLQQSKLSESAKHPLLLSKRCVLSKLLVQHYHGILLHSGPQTTRAFIQRKFWILSAHGLIRKLIHSCHSCRRWHARPVQPQMGQLPSSRVTVSRAFASVGLDMAGPFNTKETTRKKSPVHKTYFCIFTCMATKAVHLEAVSELSTPAFMACFDRFASRRSLPAEIRSDQGRNFIGAKRELKEAQLFLTDHQDEIRSELRSRQVKWNLNPAYVPHMGGLWEASVKSTKRLLIRQIGTSVLTFEEFATVLAKIEAVLNSRPLGAVSTDPSENIDYLSPGHFLVGGPLLSVSEMTLDHDLRLRCRWARVQQLTQHFWSRWSREYLQTLMQREKWTNPATNVQVGQLVYIRGERTTPLVWPIGRITRTFPGPDGVVRVVEVKTSAGISRRSVNRLALIPVL